MKRIINAANRLPVTVGKTIRKSSGGLVSAMSHLGDTLDIRWVGWPGIHPRDDNQKQNISQQLSHEFESSAVFMSKSEVRDFYHGYSNSLLWPILHYNTTDMRQRDNWWQAYKAVNLRFRDAIMHELKQGDIVWVHDYHLMLLPALIREVSPSTKVGFFLHTPFPSYETFRCIPQREELLRGILGSDLIGFHTYGYMRHFRSSAMRLLAIDAEINVIRQQTHLCHMGVYPIGIHTTSFEEELESEGFEKECCRINETYSGKRIVLNVERLDYSKGLRGRLEAIDRFLESTSAKDDFVFVFIAVPSRGEVRAYQELRDEVEALVGRINGKHSTIHNTPIQFIHDSVSFTELCALYATADVMLVTPLVDGMNLVAKEYLACRKDNTGVLVLSEFAGAANELSSALVVNPYDVDGMATALHDALEMPLDEQRERILPMRQTVDKNTAQRWANSFLNDLDRNQECQSPVSSRKTVTEELTDAISRELKIALFLDYDGTLRSFERTPDAAKPTKRIKVLLRNLCGVPNLAVYLVSGRSRENLSEWFAEFPITLIAEHGAVYSNPSIDCGWTTLVDAVDLSWKQEILNIVTEFALSTPGSSIEEKSTAIVWHYRNCDPEFGAWKAQQLTSMLGDLASNLPVEVQQGHAIVEVTSNQFSKGQSVRHLSADDNDIIVCIGDDTTDESMFKIEDRRLCTIKVGPGPTAAMHRLSNTESVIDVLESLPFAEIEVQHG